MYRRNVIDQMKSYGFNALRIPFCNEMLLNSSRTSTIIFSNSPDLEGKTPLQCLDAIVHYAVDLNACIQYNFFFAIVMIS